MNLIFNFQQETPKQKSIFVPVEDDCISCWECLPVFCCMTTKNQNLKQLHNQVEKHLMFKDFIKLVLLPNLKGIKRQLQNWTNV